MEKIALRILYIALRNLHSVLRVA